MPAQNLHNLGASTIAAIYKDRWQIELFFKALKQNLKIKTFVGTSANAVKTQIWTALICMLLLRYLQLSSKFGWSIGQPRGAAANESVHTPRSDGLDRAAILNPARPARSAAGPNGAGLNLGQHPDNRSHDLGHQHPTSVPYGRQVTRLRAMSVVLDSSEQHPMNLFAAFGINLRRRCVDAS